MRSSSYCLVLSFLLVACSASAPKPGEPDSGQPDISRPSSFPDGMRHDRAEAELVIRRYPGLRVGLLNYVDTARSRLNEKRLTGRGVVFQLKGTGDTGAFHAAAIDLASEQALALGWPIDKLEKEPDGQGSLAVVEIESLGIPADAKVGTTVPVRMTLVGDASEIRRGWMYSTVLRNSAGRTVAMRKEGALPWTGETAVGLRTRDNPLPGVKDLMEEALIGLRKSYILRVGFTLVAGLANDELAAETIELALDREIKDDNGNVIEAVKTVSADAVPGLCASIEREMLERGQAVRTEVRDMRWLVVTPVGARETSLRQVYEQLLDIKVDMKPTSSCILLWDETEQRLSVYGALRSRFLIDDVTLTTSPFDEVYYDKSGKPRPKEGSPTRFRVNCRVLKRATPGSSGQYGIPSADDERQGRTPDGDKGRVNLAWSLRDNDGDLVSEGNEEFPSADISDILRHLWTRGMGLVEVLAFCVRAKESYSIAAELGFNPRRFDPETLKTVNDGGR